MWGWSANWRLGRSRRSMSKGLAVYASSASSTSPDAPKRERVSRRNAFWSCSIDRSGDLPLGERGEGAALVEQFLVGAFFPDLAALEVEDSIGIDDRAQTVRDHDAGRVELVHALRHHSLRAIVERARRL